MNEIISQLATQFGLPSAQVEGAAGSVLKLVQQHAAGGDFQQLLGALPQIGQWIAKAPAASADAGGGGLLGALAGGLGGGAGQGLAGVLAELGRTGLKPELLAQFVPALLQQLRAHVDPALVERVLAAVPGLAQLGGGGSSGGGLGGALGGALGGLLGGR